MATFIPLDWELIEISGIYRPRRTKKIRGIF